MSITVAGAKARIFRSDAHHFHLRHHQTEPKGGAALPARHLQIQTRETPPPSHEDARITRRPSHCYPHSKEEAPPAVALLAAKPIAQPHHRGPPPWNPRLTHHRHRNNMLSETRHLDTNNARSGTAVSQDRTFPMPAHMQIHPVTGAKSHLVPAPPRPGRGTRGQPAPWNGPIARRMVPS